MRSLIDFVDRWFVILNKLLSLGIKKIKNPFYILLCARLFVILHQNMINCTQA